MCTVTDKESDQESFNASSNLTVGPHHVSILASRRNPVNCIKDLHSSDFAGISRMYTENTNDLCNHQGDRSILFQHVVIKHD